MKKILVLGYFGYKTNQLDGQTVRTRSVYKMLENNCSQSSTLSYFDIQEVKFDKFLVFTLLKKLWQADILVYLPAHNNLKYMFPIIFGISLIRNYLILCVAIGGWLPNYLKNKPIHRFMLKRINHIFTQVATMQTKLEQDYGFKNIDTLPNFRIHNFMPQIGEEKSATLKLVFMARITKIKGYETVFELADYIQNTKQNIIIDFYGQINEIDKPNFLSLVEKYNFVTYQGCIEPQDVYSTLYKYDVMLLPTRYIGEGFPGTILDSYISGIPVIVTNFPHATQCVDNNINGYIIPFGSCINELISKTMELYNDRDKLTQMKKNAYEKSKEYSEKKAWDVIQPFLNQKTKNNYVK